MTTVLREADSVKVAEQSESKSQAKTSGSIGLGELFAGTRAEVPAGAEKLRVSGIACDSRKAAPGFVFFALHGAKEDGNKYVRDAVERGAMAVASEDLAPADLAPSVAWIRAGESRKSLAISAANFFGHPAQALQLLAVTGTNGKTTTTSLIDSVLQASGAKTGLFGTIAYHTPRGNYPAPNTTPESSTSRVSSPRFVMQAASSR